MKLILLSVVTSENYIEKTLLSMKRSIDQFDFDDAILICPPNTYTGPWHGILEINENIEWGNYSEWILKNLINYISPNSYCLFVQWDSCIINPDLWTDEFLNYDYIGAVWPNQWINRVGNGGFSLRSYRFIEECSKLQYSRTGIKDYDNEDYIACVKNYHYMKDGGIKFAPINLARQFSVEHPIGENPHSYGDLSSYRSFGFHGDFNKAGMNYLTGLTDDH